MALCSCFGSSKAQREADRLESEDARAKAAEAARISFSFLANPGILEYPYLIPDFSIDGTLGFYIGMPCAIIYSFLGDFDFQLMRALANCRQEKFEKSAAGRAVRAQIAAAKQSNSPSKGEPVLKVIVCLRVTWV
ncbi:hypothetical protein MA16_Dca028295 [Dendrobium catenatum]|uniref:Uncharacterized protein n=1 Tax=Dendrobium catenatum TaxID=906689 RepID=A0A2I0V6V7_9ASPA|nr:hypothetical protein MA16_Dca028295 [Dendrobium catenatum]